MSRRMWLTAALLLVVLAAGIVTWSALNNPAALPGLRAPAATPISAEVPRQLGALRLTQTKTGPDALAEFAQLHGKGFDLLGGTMAQYEGGGSQATLWVGVARDAASAQSMVETMAQKIGPNNRAFTNLQRLSIGTRTLYTAEGMGQQHYFFARDAKIVWLAADPEDAADMVHGLWGMTQ